jgi:plastocyanin
LFLPILAFVLVVGAPIAAFAADPMHHSMPMTVADMQKWVDDFYAAHPRVGVNRTGRVADATVTVTGFRFEADGNSGTQVDTVKIAVGEAVSWEFGDGSHTVTSGTGAGDPQVGILFDRPINAIDNSFTFQFDNAGLFPYFCRVHEFFNMKGFVLVQSTSGVTPLPPGTAAIGFTRAPRPNPTRTGVDFQFALNVAGHARIDVFDARGARIATVADRDLPVGSFAARWDGTASNGRAVDSGVYWLKMSLPGYAQSRKVVISR